MSRVPRVSVIGGVDVCEAQISHHSSLASFLATKPPSNWHRIAVIYIPRILELENKNEDTSLTDFRAPTSSCSIKLRFHYFFIPRKVVSLRQFCCLLWILLANKLPHYHNINELTCWNDRSNDPQLLIVVLNSWQFICWSSRRENYFPIPWCWKVPCDTLLSHHIRSDAIRLKCDALDSPHVRYANDNVEIFCLTFLEFSCCLLGRCRYMWWYI